MRECLGRYEPAWEEVNYREAFGISRRRPFFSRRVLTRITATGTGRCHAAGSYASLSSAYAYSKARADWAQEGYGEENDFLARNKTEVFIELYSR